MQTRADVDAEETIVDRGVGDPDHLQRLWTPHRMSYIAEAPMKTGRATTAEPF
ncbi:MAG: diadenosine tetraphosphate hydrolase, partial [Actinomycetia bacterium]|nr:diadenosine tetraphosphate hydrolase [Actinomycetes bacterium]